MTGSPPDTYTVAQVCEGIRNALAVMFPTEIWVRGEITDLKRPKSGHVYFQLVDSGELGRAAQATLAVALLADRRYVVNQILKRSGGNVRMTDGVEVRVRGRLDFYPPTGRVSVLMTLIDPEYTLGRLAADRDRLLRQLAEGGLLRRQAQLPLGPAPLRIGLVTSAGSAAEHDFLAELGRSGLAFSVRTFHAQVQGTGSHGAIARALLAAGRHRCELVALVRGGGARTDLATFDSEEVALAIANLDVPVWTGIGHEIDRSVADDVAHRSFKTPTAVAQGLVERVNAFLGELDQRWGTICSVADRRLEGAERAVAHRVQLMEREARTTLRRADEGLAARSKTVLREAELVLRSAEARLEAADARLAASDPRRLLARGWSLTRGTDGTLLRDPQQVRPGAEIVTTLLGGELRSTVTGDG